MDATPRAIAGATQLCTSCPKLCRFSCPVAVADGRESSTPTAKMTLASHLASGRLPATPENAEPLYRCTGCGIQQEHCKHEVDAAGTLEAARALTYGRGALPDRLRGAEPRLRVDRAPLADELAASAARLRAASVGAAGGDAATATLLAGCRMLRDDADGVSRHLALASRALGGRVDLWSRTPICCGYPLHALGDRRQLAAQAGAFARAARDAGRIVAADPACAFMLRRVYPELGVKVKVKVDTLPELLAEGGPRLHAVAAVTRRVVYHDPCHLGRRLGVYDAPRDVLRRAGVDLVSTPAERELSPCCGYGGAYPLLEPAGARRIAATLASGLAATGAELVVTACPTCKLALGSAGAAVADLTEIVAASLA